jgi:hypothetical protein
MRILMVDDSEDARDLAEGALPHVCLFHAFHAQKMAENPKFG